MYHFQYVPKKEWKPFRDEILTLIHKVQNDLRDDFTFQYKVVGSASRNMITMDPLSNQGYDFDINLIINDPDNKYSPSEIKHMLMNSLNKYAWQYGYSPCEDSTRVITIKVKDKKNSLIKHSVDFAIVNDYEDDDGYYCQQYIHFDKPDNYIWEDQPSSFYDIPDRIEFCKDNGLWAKVRSLYLDNKNNNLDPKKKSRAIFSQTLNTICQRNDY